MRVQHNIPAINTFRQMKIGNTSASKSLERLSSGYKLNRAADDAAGLAISEKIRAQARGLNRASANAQDGISLIQAAEGAMQEVHSVLHRMRELAVQGGSDVNEHIDRHAIQEEIEQLQKEIDRISSGTEFNKKTVLDGSLTAGKYAKTISGSGVSNVFIANPVEAMESITSIAVTQAGEKFNMTFNLTLETEPAVESTNLYIAISRDVALSAGIDEHMLYNNPAIGTEENHPYFAIPVLKGDTSADIAARTRDYLNEVLNNADCRGAWNVNASGGNLTIQSSYAGRFGGCNDGAKGERIYGAFHIVAGKIDGSSGFVPASPDIFSPAEWDTGEPYAPTVGTSNVGGTMGKDMIVRVNGQIPKFTNLNFTNWTDNWTDGDGDSIPGGNFNINSANTGILRGKDTLLRLYLDNTYDSQLSFIIDNPTKQSLAVIETKNGENLTIQAGANTGKQQTIDINIRSISTVGLGVDMLNVCTHIAAQGTIASVENAITIVSAQRTELGAVQNRLEHTIANLDTVAENLQDAESRIRDADMAKEMMDFTKSNILLQSSQAMMAQANNIPQGVLQLLR